MALSITFLKNVKLNLQIFVVVQFGATSDAEVTHRNLKKKKKNYWM